MTLIDGHDDWATADLDARHRTLIDEAVEGYARWDLEESEIRLIAHRALVAALEWESTHPDEREFADLARSVIQQRLAETVWARENGPDLLKAIIEAPPGPVEPHPEG